MPTPPQKHLFGFTTTEVQALLLGLIATLAGIGLARFSFTPLLPQLILAGWFSSEQAFLLGAANLAGYFAGAVLSLFFARYFSIISLLKTCLLLILLSFICSSQAQWPAPWITWISSYHWFAGWRFIAGVTGAMLVVLTPGYVLSQLRIEQRALGGSLVFTGIGIGALLSATLIPALIEASLSLTWQALSGLQALITLAAFWLLFHLRRASESVSAPTRTPAPTPVSSAPAITAMVIFVILAYSFNALGYVPHTVFWMDYLVRDLQLSTKASSLQWILFGCGAVCGPFVAGLLARQLGFHPALIWGFALKGGAIALPLLSSHPLSLSLSSFVVGLWVPGLVALTSGRVAELVGSQQHRQFWAYATAAFALAQALSGYLLSGLYRITQDYHLLFMFGAGCLLFGLLLLIAAGRRTRAPVTHPSD